MRGSKLNNARARALRQNSSNAEHLLWRHLRNRNLEGFKFRRQLVVEPFIVDFACVEAKLIIEIDGGHHAEQRSYDKARTAFLVARGYQVRRFWNHEVLQNTESVLESIRLQLLGIPSPQPSP